MFCMLNFSGGSSAHNREVEVRGSRSLFDRWADVGGDRWRYDNLLPIFRDIEDFMSFGGAPIDTRQRGTNGRLLIRQSGNTTFSLQAGKAISKVSGQPIVFDYNAGRETSVSTTTQYYQRNAAGIRSFGADFLRGIVDLTTGEGKIKT